MKQVLFFALRDDLVPMLEMLEAGAWLQYVRTGNFSTPATDAFFSALEIPSLGIADSATASTCTSYLVCGKDAPVNVRSIAGIGGSSRFAVDQLTNPNSVVFTPAGRRNENILLHGRVATVSDTAPAQELLKLFSGAIRKRFTKVRAFYVGPEALIWLNAGKRLTISEQSPREFDLVA